jgi:hypothetical protein
MRVLWALFTIWRIVPGRVLLEVATGLRIGMKKHGRWHSDRPASYYIDHLIEHLREARKGSARDADDGHTNWWAVVIRGMQLVDQTLKREAHAKASRNIQ